MPKFIYMVLALLLAGPVFAAKEFTDHDRMMMDHGGGHLMDMGGAMVMGQNVDRVPDACSGIAGEKEITVHAGHQYAEKFPGRMYTFDIREYHFEPCTKLTIHFINDDNIRHQWMMHGLPKYIYPKGMFHLEVTGPGKVSGTLILPPADKTYLIHCDIAQHMEKGMKGQLIVGKGSGDLPSIPGVTPYVIQDSYVNTAPVMSVKKTVGSEEKSKKTGVKKKPSILSGTLIFGLLIGLIVAPMLAKKYKGMTPAEIVVSIFGTIKTLLYKLLQLIIWIIRLLLPGKRKALPGKS